MEHPNANRLTGPVPRRLLCALLVALVVQSCFMAELSLAQPSCQLPPTIQQPSPRQIDWKNDDVATDYLALVLSWSPEHCAAQTTAAQRAKHAFQCELNNFEFVVHGLWPQSRQGQSSRDHPRHCKPSPALPVDLIRRHLCTVPGADLMQNEWQAHGTCAWPDASSYFASIESLVTQINRPGFAAFGGSSTSGGTATIKAGQLKQAFANANPGKLSTDDVRVTVGSGNRLKEVWICLSAGNSPQPMACPAGGTPDSQTIKVRAPRNQPPPTPMSPGVGEPPEAADISCPSRQTRFGGYNKAAKDAFWSMYASGGRTIYCDAAFSSASQRQTVGGLPINIEHALPKSKVKVTPGQGDLHNLWPSIMKVNEARGNFALTDAIPGEQWTFAHASQPELASCDFEVESVMRPGGKVTIVEPAPNARGRLARSVLHMALAYNVKLPEQEWSTYLAWHEQHSPSADELRRNDRIEELQRTRNPFVDSPTHGRLLVQVCRGP